MRMVKPRKRRGYKKNGYQSMEMCNVCKSFGCDPMADSPAWRAKKERRYAAGVCVSCGNNPCTCKSSGCISEPSFMSNKKKDDAQTRKLKEYYSKKI